MSEEQTICCGCGWTWTLSGCRIETALEILERHMEQCHRERLTKERAKARDRSQGNCWIDVLYRVGNAGERWDFTTWNANGEWVPGGMGWSPFKESLDVAPKEGDTVRLYGERPFKVWGMDRWDGSEWVEVYYLEDARVVRAAMRSRLKFRWDVWMVRCYHYRLRLKVALLRWTGLLPPSRTTPGCDAEMEAPADQPTGGFLVPEVADIHDCGPVRHFFARLGLVSHRTRRVEVRRELLDAMADKAVRSQDR